MRVFSVCAVLLAGVSGAMADVPRVVTDIAPVRSLVDQVMEGAGRSDVLLPPGASPHSYAMRPSEARALAAADVVVWIGPALTPWLAGSVETLAGSAQLVTLTDAPGVGLLPFRTGGSFDGHNHGHEDHHEDGAHEDHDDHAHDDHVHDEHDHDAHASEGHEAKGADAHGHDHSGNTDPHIWLDPQNARAILAIVAETLAELDPENAALYRDNAARADEEIGAAIDEISGNLTALQGVPFFVFHDAYYYFEARFGLGAQAAISLAHGEGASAGHLSAVREVVAETGAVCVLAEPPVQRGLIDAVAGPGGIRIEVINPLGGENLPESWNYRTYLMQIADAFSRCLGAK